MSDHYAALCAYHQQALATWRRIWRWEDKSSYRRRCRDIASQCLQCSH